MSSDSQQLSGISKWGLKKSPWAFHLSTGSCNNCDIELLDALTPRFDIERFGIVLVGSPRHADVLFVTGIVTVQSFPRLLHVYGQMAKPCVVIALGACACTGGVFDGSYHQMGPVDKVIPVDVYIPGCPPKPETIILGVVKALSKLG
ncbi:MAG: NADH-quinone oxidoreductase subunit B family protein [Chloroflexota bacterium]|nr:NADH-quinone oxidoreductase subunit B family protein [Chloroflexota bacterium]